MGLLTVYTCTTRCIRSCRCCLQVINLSQYEIDPNYSTLFTEAGGASKEIVFAIRFKNTDQQNGEGGFLAYNYGYPMEWQLPYPNLANDFYCKDGKPITSSGIYDPDDDSTRDPRLTYTLMTKNGDTYDGKVSDAWCPGTVHSSCSCVNIRISLLHGLPIIRICMLFATPMYC